MEQKRPLTEEERAARRKERADEFWNIFLFTKNGKVKSTLMVNTFSLSVLFVAVYVLCFMLLNEWLDFKLAEHLPTWLVSVVESVVPSAFATLICCSFFFVFKDKRLIPCTYLWLVVYGLVLLIGVCVGVDAETRAFFLTFYCMFALVPLCIGVTSAWLLYRRYQRTHPVVEAPQPKKAWQR